MTSIYIAINPNSLSSTIFSNETLAEGLSPFGSVITPSVVTPNNNGTSSANLLPVFNAVIGEYAVQADYLLDFTNDNTVVWDSNC